MRDHPPSLSVREDHLLPTIDGWLAQLFNDDHLEETVNSLAAIDPDTIKGFTRQIERIRTERKTAELRLRQITTGKGMTTDEIMSVVQSVADAVKLLSAASAADRRRIYEAARLEVLHDHENRRAKLSVAPWVSDSVGGANATLNPRHRSGWLRLAAA